MAIGQGSLWNLFEMAIKDYHNRKSDYDLYIIKLFTAISPKSSVSMITCLKLIHMSWKLNAVTFNITQF